ncbi:helix-turn-helix transcriptional regulator [Halomicrobium sp. IBSBa]|uniref:winged helix-turn-helix domain-containing protein n=1 Tax=Halomicrobium sp. IBSBa TaxID=2778916 RepID=UPI001ABFC391|nr:helix-turn-helix domain-containing protein [Halomicrobium sp. IBSBa]MBO4248350.1 helix-turn-helix transcriptional regulator [Halomicrobium sp. IBSBa]
MSNFPATDCPLSGRHAEETDDATRPTVPDGQDLLELVGDPYTFDILDAITDEPMEAQEIAETTDVSQPTVYRRLRRLYRAGIVDTEVSVDGSSNHPTQFALAVTRVTLEVEDDGLGVDVESADERTGE